MKSLSINTINMPLKQAGVALFFALIALVIMSLAAVALIRSVDTNTLVAGNLSFQQSATNSADAAIEAAIAQVATMRDAVANKGLNVFQNDNHTLNQTNAATGYYSNLKAGFITAKDLIQNTCWDTANQAKDLGTDSTGNRVQYIIQRMCRFENTAINNADCLFSAASLDTMGQQIKLSKDICDGDNCPSAGQTPQIRVTVKVSGPRGSASYVQAFVH